MEHLQRRRGDPGIGRPRLRERRERHLRRRQARGRGCGEEGRGARIRATAAHHHPHGRRPRGGLDVRGDHQGGTGERQSHRAAVRHRLGRRGDGYRARGRHRRAEPGVRAGACGRAGWRRGLGGVLRPTPTATTARPRRRVASSTADGAEDQGRRHGPGGGVGGQRFYAALEAVGRCSSQGRRAPTSTT